jgi:hypothetical protein
LFHLSHLFGQSHVGNSVNGSWHHGFSGRLGEVLCSS